VKIRSVLLLLSCLLYAEPTFSQLKSDSVENNIIDWEVFPIISYDTDAGIGYGVKGYIRNILKSDESLDIILYHSTKGERWYSFQFSWPDYETRHGTEYGFALDLVADYDKWISYYFYGIGNYSSYDNRKIYTREPFLTGLILSRAITSSIIIQTGLTYSSVKFTNFPFYDLPPAFPFEASARKLSLLINVIYDSRNSTINPDSGMIFSAGFESSPLLSITNSSFSEALLTFRFFRKIILPELVFAGRLSFQQLFGDRIPVQFLLPIGGNQTLRGYRQDRFIDRSSALINAELRFPIWRSFGGIIGADAGRVFQSLDRFSFDCWRITPAAGLRFYMKNFVVRADIGISDETVGFYFNFGHIF
jgi:outer membrane protein assembly factor BamA